MHVEHMVITCTTLVHHSIQYRDKIPNDRVAVLAEVENLILKQCQYQVYGKFIQSTDIMNNFSPECTFFSSKSYRNSSDLIFLFDRDGSHAQRRHNSHEPKTRYVNDVANMCDEEFLPRRSIPPSHIPPNTELFVRELRKKLEIVRRERHSHELMHQLNLTDPSDNSSRLPPLPPKNQINHKQLVEDLKRFQAEEDNDQSILDQHVSRVWSDKTPHRSPGTVSPCNVVPNRRRTHDSIVAGGDGKYFHDLSVGWMKKHLLNFSWSINATFEINAGSCVIVETINT